MRRLCTHALFLMTLSVPAVSQAQGNYNINFRSAEATGRQGSDVTVAVGIDNSPDPITGFSFGVKHDAAKLTFKDASIGPALRDVLGGDPDLRFYSVNDSPDGGTGVTIAILFSGEAENKTLAAGTDQHVFDLVYTIADGTAGETADVEFTTELGSPAVDIILDRSGVAQKPEGGTPVTKATITITEGPPPFIRSDVNQNGSADVIDVILIIDFLFGGGSLGGGAESRENCVVVFNANGSTGSGERGIEDLADINISDAIDLNNFLFQNGVIPPPPFPACGQPEADVDPGIECTAFDCP